MAGRIYSKRPQGKLRFYDLKADGEKVQVMADVTMAGGDAEAFEALHATVKIGDIVGIEGHPGKSKKGELSIFPRTFQVLSPCLHMLPLRRLDNQVCLSLQSRSSEPWCLLRHANICPMCQCVSSLSCPSPFNPLAGVSASPSMLHY